MIDRELVIACYQAILGREPESEKVVDEKAAWFKTPGELVRDFMQSEEYRQRQRMEMDAASVPLDREFVIACYRGILGREPENEKVVDEKAAWFKTAMELVRDLMQSEEYKAKPTAHEGADDESPFVPHPVAPQTIEVDISDEGLALLFKHVKTQWTQLGEDEPYFSVLTDPKFKLAHMGPQERESFYSSGERDAALVDIFCQRNHVRVSKGTCLELGCGVGRITRYLARQFKHVIAVDISAAHLRQCEESLRADGVTNVTYVLLSDPADISKVGAFDFFFSVIVLQHNPPPVQKFILEAIFSKIRSGGGYLFQTPAHLPNYAFTLKDYTTAHGGDMEMHCLPMHTIFALAARHGLSMSEIVMDRWTGLYGSYTYFGVKP